MIALAVDLHEYVRGREFGRVDRIVGESVRIAYRQIDAEEIHYIGQWRQIRAVVRYASHNFGIVAAIRRE